MDAITKIKETYSVEELKEIADHGCQSGLCRQHIYYGDTVSFFETYEDEITDYIESCYGVEFLVNMFKEADANLRYYKNNMTWCFIEMIAFDAVDEEEQELYSELQCLTN